METTKSMAELRSPAPMWGAAAAAVMDAFRPNRAVSATVARGLIAVQIGLALLAWWFLPVAVLPKPNEVWAALGTLWMEQGLGRELATSFVLNLEALAVTAAISLALAYLTVLPAVRPLVAAASKGRFLGLIGLTFVFTLMVGGGHALKLWLLVFGMSVFFVTGMAAEVDAIPRERFDHARTLRMKEWRVVWEVVILGTLDRAIETLRQNAAIGWMMLTMVEGISRSEGGIGAMLLNQNKHFHLAEVFAIQLLILTMGIVQDYGIGVIGRLVCPWSQLTRERQ